MVIRIGDKEEVLPTRSEQVKLSQALTFLSSYKDFQAFSIRLTDEYDDLNKGIDDNMVQFIKIMSKCIASYFDMPVKEFMNEGLVLSHNIALNGAIEDINILFNHLSNIIAGYEAKQRSEIDFLFECKGEVYAIPYFLTSKTFNDINLPITTAQAIEVLEVKRLLTAHKEKNWENAYFTEIISLMAILSRKVIDKEKQTYESFPDELNEIYSFIEARKELFIDIDMVNGFDIAFFLMFTMKT